MSSMQTVSPLSIVFMLVSLLICFGVPVGLAIWAKVKYRKAFSFLPLLAGVLGFLVSQLIFRIPVLNMLMPSFEWYRDFMKMTWPYLIFMSFTAGLVEEPARFIAFSIMKKRRQYPDGLSYGIGHGGFEAIILSGITMLNYTIYAIAINTNTWESMISIVPETQRVQYNLIEQLLLTNPSINWLAGGFERIFAILLHVSLSLFLYKGFQNGGNRWLRLVAAILLHGCANLVAVGAAQLAGVWVSEGVLLVIGVLSLLYIIKQARDWRKSLNQPQEVIYAQQ